MSWASSLTPAPPSAMRQRRQTMGRTISEPLEPKPSPDRLSSQKDGPRKGTTASDDSSSVDRGGNRNSLVDSSASRPSSEKDKPEPSEREVTVAEPKDSTEVSQIKSYDHHEPESHKESSSPSSMTGSHRTSGRSSVSSIARQVMRSGPDMRLINVSKSGLAERFSAGLRLRRMSLASLKKVKTYEEPAVELNDLRSTTTAPAPIPTAQPTPPSPANRPKSPPKQSSEPGRSSKRSFATSSNLSTCPLRTHSKSDNCQFSHRLPTDDGNSEIAQSLGDTSHLFRESSSPGQNANVPTQKWARPKFPSWRSHSSHFINRVTPAITPYQSAPVTPPAISRADLKQLQPEAPQKKQPLQLKKSFKRWLRPGSLSASDAPSISEIIEPTELNTLSPARAVSPGPPTLQAPSRPPSTQNRHTRFGSTNAPTLGSIVSTSLAVSPDLALSSINDATLFSPAPRTERRGGSSSYFGEVDSPARSSPRARHASPDFTGTTHGRLSPHPSTPAKPTPTSPPKPKDMSRHDRDEYFQSKLLSRNATARSATMPRGFVPPEAEKANTSPLFRAARAGRGKMSGFFFEYPGTEDEGDSEEQPGLDHLSGGSSGHWDSDAVLMSQQGIESSDDDGSVVRADLEPQTPAPEMDWFRVRMDQIFGAKAGTSPHADVEFEWEVPEHLPGSPLCPLNPKHKSGGKGICVYHGRRKTQRMKELSL